MSWNGLFKLAAAKSIIALHIHQLVDKIITRILCLIIECGSQLHLCWTLLAVLSSVFRKNEERKESQRKTYRTQAAKPEPHVGYVVAPCNWPASSCAINVIIMNIIIIGIMEDYLYSAVCTESSASALCRLLQIYYYVRLRKLRSYKNYENMFSNIGLVIVCFFVKMFRRMRGWFRKSALQIHNLLNSASNKPIH